MFAFCLGIEYLLSWLFEGEPSLDYFNWDKAFIFCIIVAVGWTLQDLIIGLGREIDSLKNEIGGHYGEGGLKGKMDNLEEKMDEIRRDLRRNEKSGRTKEKSEEED